ncbi:hypothetical protein F0L68_07245 [Solihabitans fulvus]|uniref:Uncharacterized protein n=1 Tax=Solihabitans fulvus TaxID=1892852 RepID=A0A5B2XNC1_9PSEU|nr:hypothetical protein [Solihabitans fulvus]KAA2264863.1 hypothetical protein F0L68_07245 [Solihabitans fulvus]
MSSLSSAVEVLKRLRRCGFDAHRYYAENGELDAIGYTRCRRGLWDVVLVYSSREALGYRVRADDFNQDDPFVIRPGAQLWRVQDCPATVVTGVLALSA